MSAFDLRPPLSRVTPTSCVRHLTKRPAGRRSTPTCPTTLIGGVRSKLTELANRFSHVSEPRALKQQLVNEGLARAALVFDEAGVAQGWCQYGKRDDLLLKHKRGYEQEPPPRASWRIACIFVDKRHRRHGVARAALEGALAQIASAGGGLVEAISETTSGRKAQDRFLFSATVELFEDFDFSRIRQVGKHAWIVSRTIAPA